MNCLTKYGTPENFLSTFNSQKTFSYLSAGGRERMIISQAPSLVNIRNAFGRQTEMEFIEELVSDAAKFFGMSGRTSEDAVVSICEMISAAQYDLKATELMLFFYLFKSSFFRTSGDDDASKMYGTFSGEVISDCLYRFRKFRNSVIDDYEMEQNKKKREESFKNVATPEQRDEIIRRNLHSGNRDMLAALNDANHWGLTLPPPDNSKRIAELAKSIENSKIHLRCMTEQAALASTDETRDRFNDAADKVRTKIASLEAELKQLSNGG